jgi:acyl-CoA thioesterase-1
MSFFLSTQLFATKNILIIGDSLSASYGIEENKGWVALLQNKLSKEHGGYNLINSSISGETTSGGLNRLPALLQKYKPAILIIELGANDGLRGLPLKQVENNLQKMIQLGEKSNAKILLLAVRIPTNYGQLYTQSYEELFTKVAQENKVLLLSNLLEGIDEHAEMFQDDALHPNQEAQPVIFNNVWTKLSDLLN